MKKIFYAAVVLMAAACKKETTAVATENPPLVETRDSLASPQQTALLVQSFGFPSEVDGCSCYFATDKENFNNEKYIYVDDYGNNAFLHLNGKQVKIKMEEGDFDPEHFTKTISNEDYTVTLSGKKLKEVEELMVFEGDITIKSTNGATYTSSVYGECGC